MKIRIAQTTAPRTMVTRTATRFSRTSTRTWSSSSIRSKGEADARYRDGIPQAPLGEGHGDGRAPGAHRDRAVRARLRPHARQRAAARAAVLDARLRGHR